MRARMPLAAEIEMLSMIDDMKAGVVPISRNFHKFL
jgi:hypothetical protein